MRMLVTDLTRMREGTICVAGIDPDTGKRVRPVGTASLPAALLNGRDGPFDVGRIIDLGSAYPAPSPPEIEDVRVNIYACRHAGSVTMRAFVEALRAAAVCGLDAFGPALVAAGRSGLATAEGTGACSLAIVRWEGPLDVSITPRNQLRADLGDGRIIAVTDARLYQPDLMTPHAGRVRWLQQQITSGEDLFLAFGLSRAFSQRPGEPKRHWLQLNNLHPAGARGWQVGWDDGRYAAS